MRFSYHVVGSIVASLPLGFAHGGPSSPSDHLELSAVVSGADGKAAFECWRFDEPFITYPTAGKSMDLAALSNVTYVVLPPGSNEGIHKPPHPMLFALLSGIAHITLPASGEEMHLEAGVNGLIVANDITGEGHITEYPSTRSAIALQLPFDGGVVPPHTVISDTPCAADDPRRLSIGFEHIDGGQDQLPQELRR